MSWKAKKVLVTGAGGFIGSHLTERLVRDGAEVTAFVRYNGRGDPGQLSLLDPEVRSAVRVVAGDLSDASAVRAAVHGQDVVFHLAALVAIPYSYLHPAEVAQVNVIGSLNVLNAVREHGVSRLLHVSTSEIYGSAQQVPIGEAHRTFGQSPYSASKIGAEAMAQAFVCSFGLPVTIVRPFNTYGPRQSARAVVPAIVGQALFAECIKLGSVTPTRDFTFVADMVAGFMAAATCQQAVGETLNLGSGSEVSIGDLASHVMQLVGRDVPLVTSPERIRPTRSEVVRQVCNASRMHSLTGWAPRVTLREGLQQVIASVRADPTRVMVNGYHI